MASVIEADEIPDAEIVRLLDTGATVELCGNKIFGMVPGEDDVVWATNAYGQDYCGTSNVEIVKATRRYNGECGLMPPEY